MTRPTSGLRTALLSSVTVLALAGVGLTIDIDGDTL